MSAKARGYIHGSAGRETTAAANRAAFDRWSIVPRVLRDVSDRSLAVDLLGSTLPAPILLAPIGAIELAHRDADVAVGRAAASCGLPLIVSNQASATVESIAAAMDSVAPGSPRWFQLYWSTSDDVVRSLVHRAEGAGCTAIVLTLDTTQIGWRPQDLDNGYLPFAHGKGLAQYTADPEFQQLAGRRPADPKPSLRELSPALLRAVFEMARAHPGRLLDNLTSDAPRRAVQTFVETYSKQSLQWADLHRLRAMTSIPVVLKGILHPDDAALAVDAGIDGIIVSTHGGRQIDGEIAALDALPAIVQAVAGGIPVLLDSGIRGGSDVFKALALGATAVCVGRPYAYGLALAGERGVTEVLQNIVAEFDLTLALSGHRSAAEIGPDVLMREQL